MSVHAEAPARRVPGPAALSGDWRRFFNLTMTLALTDWKLRFFGSALGYVWSLLRPLLLFGILYLVFSQIVKIGEAVPNYPLVLLIGVVLFAYFAEVTGDCVSCVVDRESLVRKVSFPRMVVPLSVAVSSSFNLALNLIVVAIFVVISGVEPRLSWLLLPIPILLLVVLATGVGMLLAALYVTLRDIGPIWDVIAQGLFYATPVFFPIEFVLDNFSQTAGRLAMANPLATIITETRYLLIGPELTSASEAIGGGARLLIPVALIFFLSVLGFWVFNRTAPRVAEAL
ncbi:MAG TPA: ABC transporter permease [Thermoleophilaceae bacterium]|nr:ABC transporter permease [Thermoleophilaceae bacterium]